MNSKEGRIAEITARIELLENELRELKNEKAALEGVNRILDMTIQELEIYPHKVAASPYSPVYKLKKAGCITVGDVIALSEVEFSDIVSFKSDQIEILKKIEEIEGFSEITDKIEGIKKRHKEKKQEIIKMSENLVPAVEVYVRTRIEATQRNIRFSYLSSGIFTAIYREAKNNPRKYADLRFAKGLGIVSMISERFLNECMEGKHPAMYSLLTGNGVNDLQQIKAAILEDFTENNVIFNHESDTYTCYLRYIELLQEFEE